MTTLSDALDEQLRPGQKRNTADDVFRYAEAAGFSVEMRSSVGRLPRLLDANGEPTADGQNVIDFCALRNIAKGAKEWHAAVTVLKGTNSSNAGDHPLTDGLIIIRRRS